MFIKNMKHEETLKLSEQVAVINEQIVSKTLTQNEHVGVTLFAFDKGEGISAHDSDGDALVFALEGRGEITIEGKAHTVGAGEAIVMPAKKQHAVYASEPFKMLLVVVFPPQ